MKKLLSLLAFSFSVFTANTQIITSVAGNGISGFTGDGGQATAAELNGPLGVAGDASGNLYFSDVSNYRIRKVNTAGVIITIAGNGVAGYSGDGGPATSADIEPEGISIDANGNILIAEFFNERIRKINTLGIITTIAGTGSVGFSGDGGPATAAKISGPEIAKSDASGNIYIADNGNGRIRKINTSGIITTIVGNGTFGYSGDGGPATAAELKGVMSMAPDSYGNLYVVDFTDNRIRMVNNSGIISTFAGNGTHGFFGDGGPATSAELYEPEDAEVDVSGNVYISDYGNCRIRIINTSGIIRTFAGNGFCGFSGDGGQASSAELNAQTFITIDVSGNMYIADGANWRVRKISGVMAVNEVSENTEPVKLYPNPNRGAFTLQVKREKGKGESMLEIYNMLGKEIYSRTFNIQNSTFNISGQPAGIYMYRIVDAEGKETGSGKFIIE